MSKRHRDLLLYLAGCPDLHLFFIIVVLRTLFLLYMVFCHRVFPCLFQQWKSRNGQSLALDYDSCGRLYDDQRLTELRHWDGVHMYHIANHGYTHETLFVFFPFLPFLIRFVRWYTVHVFPLLYRLAPISFYVSGLNIIASAGAGVILRRLTILTMLGHRTKRNITLWRGHEKEKHTNIERGYSVTAHEVVFEKHHGDPEAAMEASALCTSGTTPVSPLYFSGSLSGMLVNNQNRVNPTCSMNKYHDCGTEGILVHFPNARAADVFCMIQGYHGTLLDKLPPLLLTTSIQDTSHPVIHEKMDNDMFMSNIQETTQKNITVYSPSLASKAAKEVTFRWRAVGGAVLVWILTPAVVFTVSNYTESIFSFFTMLGIYSLVHYRPLPRIADTKLKETEGVIISRCAYPSPKPRGKTTICGESDCHDMCSIHWKQALTSWHEVVAVMCFMISSCIRSNGFVCVGFLLYPTVLQIFFSQSYRERWEILHGPYWASFVSHTSGKKPLKTETQLEGCEGGMCLHMDILKLITKEVHIVRTLYTPTRFPHPLRLVILLFECALIFIPYLSMGYLGWKRYVGLWSQKKGHIVCNNFLKFYNVLQKKFWNVGFMRAYTVTNFPNVIIALPIGLILLYTSYRYAFQVALRSDFWPSSSSYTESIEQGKHSIIKTAQRVLVILQSMVQSSNVVYLCVLCLIAFTVMHVQVVNRFVMCSPALYWLIGAQFATRPNSRVTCFILFYVIVWGLTGGLLFSNFMPWT
ncbi:unnamed protein product [Phytomonas sp. Hart1]|nr:unnamed protein product [Phytomonas sp. Hart1]|eukprot:CCW69144.1 unnamed protein product [Phytomonas sp. isolate Hart1]